MLLRWQTVLDEEDSRVARAVRRPATMGLGIRRMRLRRLLPPRGFSGTEFYLSLSVLVFNASFLGLFG